MRPDREQMLRRQVEELEGNLQLIYEILQGERPAVEDLAPPHLNTGAVVDEVLKHCLRYDAMAREGLALEPWSKKPLPMINHAEVPRLRFFDPRRDPRQMDERACKAFLQSQGRRQIATAIGPDLVFANCVKFYRLDMPQWVEARLMAMVDYTEFSDQLDSTLLYALDEESQRGFHGNVMWDGERSGYLVLRESGITANLLALNKCSLRELRDAVHILQAFNRITDLVVLNAIGFALTHDLVPALVTRVSQRRVLVLREELE